MVSAHPERTLAQAARDSPGVRVSLAMCARFGCVLRSVQVPRACVARQLTSLAACCIQAKGQCTKGAACKFRHSDAGDDASTRAPRSGFGRSASTGSIVTGPVVCRHWAKHGKCRDGASCRFAHEGGSMTHDAGAAPNVNACACGLGEAGCTCCWKWMQGRQCRNPHCKYTHGEPGPGVGAPDAGYFVDASVGDAFARALLLVVDSDPGPFIAQHYVSDAMCSYNGEFVQGAEAIAHAWANQVQAAQQNTHFEHLDCQTMGYGQLMMILSGSVTRASGVSAFARTITLCRNAEGSYQVANDMYREHV